MDLRQFYLQNVQESEYHYRFLSSVKNINMKYNVFDRYTESKDACTFEVYDLEESIAKFRELCQPGKQQFSQEDKCWFYLVTYHLHRNGYVIKEFPKLLERPPDEPMDFVYRDIRDKIIANGDDDGGTIRF